jgi:hypothetical protein
LSGAGAVKHTVGGTYNQRVRRFSAVLVLTIFASLNAIDGICCPDGCTHEQEQSSRPTAPQANEGICVLCVGGLSTPGSEGLSPAAPVITAVARLAGTTPTDVPPDPPEHPPRF